MQLEYVLDRLCKDYNDGAFAPILEADVVAHLYHLWISQFENADKVHLDTRLCVTSNEKFDFVVGEIDRSEGRPCIEKPELIIEAKVFPIGFTDPQHRVHWKHVIEDDIPKLAGTGEQLSNRYILLFDEDDYLRSLYRRMSMSKLDYVKYLRDQKYKEIGIINVRKTEILLWEFL